MKIITYVKLTKKINTEKNTLNFGSKFNRVTKKNIKRIREIKTFARQR